MKVKVKAPFFDAHGIHKKGEICEVANFNPVYMELLDEGKTPETKVEKAIKKVTKTTRRKG